MQRDRRRDPHRPPRPLPGDAHRELATRRTRSPTPSASARRSRRSSCVVVIDVAMTETARHADYVLPAASQFEKCEATFFNLEFPRNTFHLRHPLLEPLAGHAARARDPRAAGARARRRRRARARAAARGGRAEVAPAFAQAFMEATSADPALARAAAVRPLRDARPDAAATARAARAALWGLAHRCAMKLPRTRSAAPATPTARRCSRRCSTAAPGSRLHARRLRGRRGLRDAPRTSGSRSRSPSCSTSCARWRTPAATARRDEFPLVLSAGERRAYTANTSSATRPGASATPTGALRISPRTRERSAWPTAAARASRPRAAAPRRPSRSRDAMHRRARLAAQRLRAWTSPASE